MELIECTARELPKTHHQIELSEADQYDKVFIVKKHCRSGEYAEYFVSREEE